MVPVILVGTAIGSAIVGYATQKSRTKKVLNTFISETSDRHSRVAYADKGIRNFFEDRFLEEGITLTKNPRDMSREEMGGLYAIFNAKDEEEVEKALKTGVVTDKRGNNMPGVQDYAEYIAQAVKEGISAGIKGVRELMDTNDKKVDKPNHKKYHNIKKVMEKTNKVSDGEAEAVPQRAVETNKAEAAALETKKEEGSTEKFATLGQFMKKGGE